MHNSRNLSGTFVIFFSNCTISLDGKSFNTITFPTKTLQTIIPLDGVKIDQNGFESTISLHEIREMHIQNREQLQIDRNRNYIQTSTSLGLSSSCIIIGFCIAVYTWCKKKALPNETNSSINTQRPTIVNSEATGLNKIVSGLSNLEGEAVNSGSLHFPTTQTPVTKEQLISIINKLPA